MNLMDFGHDGDTDIPAHNWEQSDDSDAPDVHVTTKVHDGPACQYCGLTYSESLVRCNICRKWFCNGRGSTTGSHIVTHLVCSKHREVSLHPDNPLGGENQLDCYICGSKNIFLLGFLPSNEESVVVLVCREPCLNSTTLHDMNWNPASWVPLIENRSLLAWLAKVPPKRMMESTKAINNAEAAQLEDLWRKNPNGTLEDLQSQRAGGAPLFPILPLSFANGFALMAAFEPLIEEECRIDREMKLAIVYSNLKVDWSVGVNRRRIATLQIPTEHGKFKCGDELLLMHPSTKWEAKCLLVRIVAQPIAGEELYCELCDTDGDIAHTTGFTVQFIFNDVTFKRMKKAIDTMAKDEMSLSAHLYSAFLGLPVAPAPVKITVPSNLSAPNLKPLNHSQQRAVAAALSAPLSLIQGPPGTGKSATSAALVYHLSAIHQSQILVCTPSNVSCDHLAERISQTGIKVLRIVGRHRESIVSTVEPLTLHRQVEQFALRAPETSEINRLVRLKEELGYLSDRDKRKFVELTKKIEENFIVSADVICTTCTVAGDPRLSSLGFKYVVIDESTQAKEPETLIPLVMGAKQVVLVGDHCQMGPVVLSKPVERAGFGRSTFERMIALGHRPMRLDIQYRMHPCLSEFSSNAFYEGSLQNGVTASERMSTVEFPWPDPERPMVFINSTSPEEIGGSGTSFINRTEAAIAERILTTLIKRGADPTLIGVITPYEAQRGYLANYIQRNGTLPQGMYQRVEIASVDAFQGREKEFVVVSCVRSNDMHSIGFLVDWRRLNVALTRARRGLVIIGNCRVLSCNCLWHELISHFARQRLVVEGPVHELRPVDITLVKPRLAEGALGALTGMGRTMMYHGRGEGTETASGVQIASVDSPYIPGGGSASVSNFTAASQDSARW